MTTDDTLDDTLGASTLQAARIDRLSRARVPILTILYHPELERVGERSWLNDPGGKGSVRVSRLHPAFGRLGDADTTPLRDKHLSRTPHRLEMRRDGAVAIAVSPDASSLDVDGVRMTGARNYSPEDVDRGVVLTLGGRVVLLLHTENPMRATPGDDLGLVGQSHAIARVRDEIRRVADFDVPVLVRGESGTGKELVAAAIHSASARRGRAFASVNMAALVPTTAAAALFGHTRGAFTGATQPSDGFFGAADGGTLFLDEIGETPGEVQPALLRALENGEVQPLGAGSALVRDVRVVTATDADLEHAVVCGRFRLPLLQRLAGYEISVPPLRDRKQDIPMLLLHFLRELLEERGRPELLEARRRLWLPPALVADAVLAPWPGNVRELRNFARRLVIDHADARTIDVERAARLLGRGSARSQGDVPPPAPTQERRLLREISEDAVLEALRRHDYKPGSAARELGVSRPSLYALIESSARIRKAGDLEAAEIATELARADGDIAKAARQLEVSVRGLQLRMKQLSCA